MIRTSLNFSARVAKSSIYFCEKYISKLTNLQLCHFEDHLQNGSEKHCLYSIL